MAFIAPDMLEAFTDGVLQTAADKLNKTFDGHSSGNSANRPEYKILRISNDRDGAGPGVLGYNR